MSDNSLALKKSFFKEYFFYKLRTLRGFMILFAVMNLMSIVLLSAGILVYANTTLLPYIRGDIENQYAYGMTGWLSLLAGAVQAVIFAELLMLAIVPAVNFKLFNKRAYMDTIGALPLTEKQRFFGDMLSGISSYVISFIPCCVISVILAAITEFGPLREVHRLSKEQNGDIQYMIPEFEDKITNLILICLATLLICCAAAYAISCFVTSCCGRVGTSVLFSVILIGGFTIIAFTFSSFIAESAIGVYDAAASFQILSAVPPLGTLYAMILNMRYAAYMGNLFFTVTTPLILVVLLIIAAFAAGAYFAAKRRKAERVGREIVFDAGYYVIPAIIILIAAGFCSFMVDGLAPYSIPLILISLATCLVMAFLQSRSLKKLWKGFVVFAVTSAVCFGFGVLVRDTKGLGISKIIPSKQSVESVELFGPYIIKLFNWDGNYNNVPIKSDEGISLILSEHKKIVDDLDNYTPRKNDDNGSWISIKYRLKGGLVSYRSYGYYGDSDTDPLAELAQNVSELPELRYKSVIGVLEDPAKPCINIIYKGRRPDDLMNEEQGISLMVKPSEQKRFAECIKNDLMNSPVFPDEDDHMFGIMVYNYLDSSGERKSYSHALWYSYEETIAFLKDPDNFEEETEITVDETKQYTVHFSISENNRISYTITYPELAREFMSYLEPAYDTSTDEYSTHFIIIQDNDGYDFRIKKENEQAAFSAFMKAIRAHRALGGDDHDQN